MVHCPRGTAATEEGTAATRNNGGHGSHGGGHGSHGGHDNHQNTQWMGLASRYSPLPQSLPATPPPHYHNTHHNARHSPHYHATQRKTTPSHYQARPSHYQHTQHRPHHHTTNTLTAGHTVNLPGHTLNTIGVIIESVSGDGNWVLLLLLSVNNWLRDSCLHH